MTEICITKAYSTQMMLGGMIGPMIAEAAMTGTGRRPGVAVLFHGGNEHAAKNRRVSSGGTAQTSQHDVGRDTHLSQTAAPVPHADVRKTDQSLGDAAHIHEFPGQHEQRDGQQRKLIHTADEFLRQILQEKKFVGDNEIAYPTGRQSECDRNAYQHQSEKYGDKTICEHGSLPKAIGVGGSRHQTAPISRSGPRPNAPALQTKSV